MPTETIRIRGQEFSRADVEAALTGVSPDLATFVRFHVRLYLRIPRHLAARLLRGMEAHEPDHALYVEIDPTTCDVTGQPGCRLFFGSPEGDVRATYEEVVAAVTRLYERDEEA